MHLAFENLAKLDARGLADGLDGLALVAEHDLALAVAFNIDDLLNAHVAVLHVFPFFRLDMGVVRQFLMQALLDFLAGDFRCQRAHRHVGNLVFGIEPRPFRQSLRQPVDQILAT